MPRLELVRSSYDALAVNENDLGKMVSTPASPVQFEGKIADIRQKLELDSTKRLLDVGCGNAYVLRSLRPFVGSAAGVDFSENLLSVACQLLPDCTFAASGADRLPFPDASFDRVLCYGVFLHFPNMSYARAAIKELCRVCRDGGIVLV